VKEGSK